MHRFGIGRNIELNYFGNFFNKKLASNTDYDESEQLVNYYFYRLFFYRLFLFFEYFFTFVADRTNVVIWFIFKVSYVFVSAYLAYIDLLARIFFI